MCAMRTCEWCGREVAGQRTGRPRRFCSQRCRKASSRSPFPGVMIRRRAWCCSDGKRPVQPSGLPASSTDPRTWTDFSQVRSSGSYGVMLGGGLGCYDLDHVTDEQARAFIATIAEPVIFAERSISGEGVHVFVELPPAPGWRRAIEGVSVERYSRARFIRTTGRRFEI